MNIRDNWWKALAVFLVAYSLLAGLWIPLGAGITDVELSKLECGELNTFRVGGYNTYFKQDEKDLTAQIRLDEHRAIPVQSIKAHSETEVALSFLVPSGPITTDTTPIGKNKRARFPILEVWGPKTEKATLDAAFRFVDRTPDTLRKGQIITAFRKSYSTQLRFPFINRLEETVRNLYYHVPMWFGMMLIMLGSVVCSILYLRTQNIEYDHRSKSLALIGTLFGVLGLVTGALWAKYTWGQYWSWDVKQNMSAVAVLIYFAYFVLRNSFDDPLTEAKSAAAYNIFAFASLVPLLFIIPRLAQSLHPGADGNPAFGSYDLDASMRMVFYPSIIGWTLLGVWLAQIHLRQARIEHFLNEEEYN
jgi:heme exporter protein C